MGRAFYKLKYRIKESEFRMKIKAISVKQPWASLITSGSKTIETRKWFTKYRGDILIVSSKSPRINNLPTGQALCIAEIIDCRVMTYSDRVDARCEIYPGAYSWVLGNIRPIKPFAVKGQLGIYEVEIPQEIKERSENMFSKSKKSFV